ncbi:MAG: hypothetical protein LBS54_05950 [Dysgonamonadaceae bacterium]|jgi:hypothetical protein|nr:hypothetical protein [Dysgonamonadaceae bacterium]
MKSLDETRKSTAESGTATNIANYNKLIGKFIIFGPAYNPQNDLLKIPNMQEQSAKVQHSINDVDYWLAVSKIAEEKRKQVFQILLPTVTRVPAVAIALGMLESSVKHIKEIVKKMRGVRVKPILPTPPIEEIDPKKYISVSQTSFSEQIEHMNKLISYLEQQPKYTPAETDLKISGLNKLRDEMGATNDAAIEANNYLQEMRGIRDELMYASKTGMVDTALAAKEYVKAIFGAASWQYKEVRHIKFKNKKIQKNIVISSQTYSETKESRDKN